MQLIVQLFQCWQIPRRYSNTKLVKIVIPRETSPLDHPLNHLKNIKQMPYRQYYNFFPLFLKVNSLMFINIIDDILLVSYTDIKVCLKSN